MIEYVVVIRLITGQDVVAIIVDEGEQIIEVENPFLISYNSAAGGAIFRPYSSFTDDHNFRFKNESIITISQASNDVATYYLELNEKYSNYIQERQSVKDLKQLLDEIGIDDIGESEMDESLFDLDGKFSIPGNDTKH